MRSEDEDEEEKRRSSGPATLGILGAARASKPAKGPFNNRGYEEESAEEEDDASDYLAD